MFRNIIAHLGKGVLVLALASLASPLAAAEYSIYVKGSNTAIIAKAKPTLKDGFYHFQDLAGNYQKLKQADVDESRTKKHNEEGLAGSYAIQGQGSLVTQPIVQPTPAGPNLGEIARQRRGEIKDATAVFNKETEPTPEPLERAAQIIAKATPDASAPVNSPLVEAFIKTLETASIRSPKVSQIQNGMKIQANTDNEQQVFSAIGAVARGLKEQRALGKPVDRVDLSLNTSSGENAGRFIVTADDAETLLTGKMSVAKWFMANVQF